MTEEQMDEDEAGGVYDKAKGGVKEAAGKLTGDAALQEEGKAQKVSGSVENPNGGADAAGSDES